MDDYAFQNDLAIAQVVDVDLWNAHHHGEFYSNRFSRCDETFLYVKIDRRDGFSTDVGDRMAVEEKLNLALHPGQLGCTMGGGTGLRYSYIELACPSIQKAVPLICETLRTCSMPAQTWLLFHDAHLADEWVGLYQSTPPPPVPTVKEYK